MCTLCAEFVAASLRRMVLHEEYLVAILLGLIRRTESLAAGLRRFILHKRCPLRTFRQGTPDPRRPTPSFRTRHPRPEETHSGLSDKATPTRGDPFGAFGQGTPDPGRPIRGFRTRHPRPGETHSGLSDKTTPTQGDLLRLSQRGGTGLRPYNSCYFSSRRPSLFASEKHTSCKNTPSYQLAA